MQDHDPAFADVERAVRAQGVVAAPVTIGNGVHIGPRTLVAAGVTVGAGAELGAILVIDTDVPAGARIAGRRFNDAGDRKK